MLFTPIKKCIDRKIEKKHTKSSTSKEWTERGKAGKGVHSPSKPDLTQPPHWLSRYGGHTSSVTQPRPDETPQTAVPEPRGSEVEGVKRPPLPKGPTLLNGWQCSPKINNQPSRRILHAAGVQPSLRWSQSAKGIPVSLCLDRLLEVGRPSERGSQGSLD